MNNDNKVEVLKHLSPEMLEVLRYQDEHSKDAFNTVGLSTRRSAPTTWRSAASGTRAAPSCTAPGT